ncbi:MULTISPECIES: PDR/VanB family oxidoreductase [Mycolicibacterium]|uniref:Iron-sulfur oxidoreductase n=1 Tax=Mycolicibacterium senegalense TaxID=1796 RepID=A0A378WBE8_9MYCO|nr:MULTISPECIES: PDR/VanB family oxidoreductase [Mycolicibacterium]MCV7337039.1 oxidoreductase [Mycolicibacterium senegalense]MDR7292665.1 ferredoxin-NADP reductase [Mycolicibacterium senegalense]QZA24005.1 PDR/VanB family oxidoreductase [Mycolicibacterium senegalense]CDP88113.1 phenoxybenzoate dioxygenase subunit beta [Mycolicibacterium farcinogenes]SUA29551.1 Iron-sulfur oxidoreductase [Mycolicibacterium senegalense]
MFSKYRTLAVPPHVHGKYRRDPLMLLVTMGYDAVNWLDKFTSTPDLPAASAAGIEAVVETTTTVTADETVRAITLRRSDHGQLPRWSAGAHIDLTLPSGRVRQYSLCGDPTDSSRYRIAVRRLPDSRGGSIEVHTDLNTGTAVRISEPRNAFPLAVGGYGQRTTQIRFIAGGIGITPILPMLTVANQFQMPWSLVYCGRSRDAMAFVDELEQFGDKVTLHYDDQRGPADANTLLGNLEPSSAVYTCGPPAMIESLRETLAGRRDVEFHYERFSAAPVVDGQEFEIELASTSEIVTVAADQTALSAILKTRPDATYSCQQGFCRSCAVRVLAGTPEHRSTALSPTEMEEGYFLPCVSRSQGRLSIDL